MTQNLTAVYHDGAFFPENPCSLPEGTRVTLQVEVPELTASRSADAEARREKMQTLLARMMANPIPANSPKFSREELHERR